MAMRQTLFVAAGVQLASSETYCPTLGDFDVAWGSVSGEGNGWRVDGEGGVHGRTSWNLLGGYIEFDMDVCGAQTGVNNNFYTISPQGGPSSGYCDIQTNDSPICMELDIIENNGRCLGQTTWHVWGNKDGGCDQNGCYGQYHLDDGCQFHMRTEFHEDGGITQYRNGQVIQVNGGPSGNEKNQIKQNMESTGASIASTQWTGWVPDDGSCGWGDSPFPPSQSPGPSGEESNGAQFAVTNVVVYAPRGIKYGPAPPTCAGPSPSPSPSPSPGMCSTSVGKNNDGTNLQSSAIITSSADDCCSSCSSTSGCVGYTWVHANGECWLKSAVDSLRDDGCGGCVTSGTYSAPTTTPAPPAPTPSPSPSPSPSGCPGGSLASCIQACPTEASVFAICVEECDERCSDSTSCTGGDDGSDLYTCVHGCPSEGFSDCLDCCTGKFPSAALV